MMQKAREAAWKAASRFPCRKNVGDFYGSAFNSMSFLPVILSRNLSSYGLSFVSAGCMPEAEFLIRSLNIYFYCTIIPHFRMDDFRSVLQSHKRIHHSKPPLFVLINMWRIYHGKSENKSAALHTDSDFQKPESRSNICPKGRFMNGTGQIRNR